MDINVSYLAAAKVGETITATGRVLKMGASLGFTDVVIRNESGVWGGVPRACLNQPPVLTPPAPRPFNAHNNRKSGGVWAAHQGIPGKTIAPNK